MEEILIAQGEQDALERKHRELHAAQLRRIYFILSLNIPKSRKAKLLNIPDARLLPHFEELFTHIGKDGDYVVN